MYKQLFSNEYSQVTIVKNLEQYVYKIYPKISKLLIHIDIDVVCDSVIELLSSIRAFELSQQKLRRVPYQHPHKQKLVFSKEAHLEHLRSFPKYVTMWLCKSYLFLLTRSLIVKESEDTITLWSKNIYVKQFFQENGYLEAKGLRFIEGEVKKLFKSTGNARLRYILNDALTAIQDIRCNMKNEGLHEETCNFLSKLKERSSERLCKDLGLSCADELEFSKILLTPCISRYKEDIDLNIFFTMKYNC